MSKRILAFMVALMSFMMFIPVYADGPTPEKVRSFQDKFMAELGKAMSVLEQNPTIAYQVRTEGDVAVVGDLHGDYQVLTKIIEAVEPRLKDRSISAVVFLGDYMDRGNNSALTLYLLLRFYNEHPGRVVILRGNHETMSVNPQNWPDDPYFKDLNPEIFRKFFNALPIMVFINEHTLAVHGGIPVESLWDAFAEGFLRDEKPSDRMEYLEPGADLFSDAIHSILWSDVTEQSDMVGKPNVRAPGDTRVSYYDVNSWTRFVKFMQEKTHGMEYNKFFANLCWLIRGHQPFYIEGDCIKGIACYRIGNIITFHCALENQFLGEDLYKAGAKVAIVPKEAGPPIEWLTIKFDRDGSDQTILYSGDGSGLPIGARRI